ncbi:MAG TPA: hypothetical protein VFJ82_24335 [Longimicrobium sp.]|nr:hypothetical protein [Longimicrobium sp.]
MAVPNHSRQPAAQSQRRLYVAAGLAAFFVIVPGLLYLCAIPLGWVSSAQRLGIAEATVFAAILAFTLVLILIVGAGVERLSISGKGVEFQLRKVQDQVASLRFLISYFLSEDELKYLQGLSSSSGFLFDFTKKDGQWFKGFFRNDLRRLRALGLIRMQDGKSVGNIPDQGNLSEHCKITDRGEEYLKLRREVDAETE